MHFFKLKKHTDIKKKWKFGIFVDGIQTWQDGKIMVY